MSDLSRLFGLFDRQPELVCIELRVGDIPWLMYGGVKEHEYAGMSDVKVTAPDTVGVVREFYPDPEHSDWAHFYSGGIRVLRHPEHPVLVRIRYEPQGFNLLFLRATREQKFPSGVDVSS